MNGWMSVGEANNTIKTQGYVCVCDVYTNRNWNLTTIQSLSQFTVIVFLDRFLFAEF